MARLSAAQLRSRQATDALVAQVEGQVGRALRGLQGYVTEQGLARILRERDAVALHDLVGRLPQALRPALATLRLAFDVGVRLGAAGIPTMTTAFTAVDPDAVLFASRYTARLVRQVTEDTRAALRAVVTRSFAEGIPPREAASLIRPLIGLTRRQASAVVSRLRSLVASGVSRRDATRQAKAYAERLLRQRALAIARTETIRASAQGQLASWRAATNRGLLKPGAQKVWLVTDDDRLCPRCRPLADVAVALDEAFAPGISAPPLHPLCRCAVAVRPVPLSLRRVAA